MNISKSDLLVIALYFVIAIPVTVADAWNEDHSWTNLAGSTIVYVIFTLLATYLIAYVLLPKYLPQRQYILLFPLIVLVLVVLGSVEVILYRIVELDSLSQVSPSKVLSNLVKPGLWVWGLISSTENAGLLIAIIMGKRFFDAQLTLQEREKEKKENELRLLKSQIDPHFLFNNLNTLDALIDTDSQRAKTYVNKLSQLYRFLIRTKDDEVVLLEEELTFAENYIYLLEQRFGNAYQFDIQNQVDIDNAFVPPGALQTLLENVVKHNITNNTDPIRTDINISNETITVTNTLRRKSTNADSYGIGLSNLKARYKLLSNLPIKISDDTHFQVVLPIIKSI